MLAHDVESKPKALVLHLCKVRAHNDRKRVVSEIHATLVVSLIVADAAGDVVQSK